MTLAIELEELAAFSDTLRPAITRIVFTEPDLAARAWLTQKCVDAGLTVREDAIGNMFARWPGSDPSLGAVGTGSHIDAIPNSGRYDGTVGVLGALEAIRILQRSGFKPVRSIELLLFTSEEPTRFGLGCLGSRMLSGMRGAEQVARLMDSEGRTVDEVRKAAGFAGSLASVALPPGYYSAFVELHIEQGPLLEARGLSIGAVTSIAGPAALRATVHGSGGHAGAVLMPQRRDALVGAAEMVIAVERAALDTGAIDSVATTGVCNVFPGAVNSVPSQVKLEIDVRDTDLARRDAMLSQIQAACQAIAERRNLRVMLELLNSDDPATCAPAIVSQITRAADELGLSHLRMVSRAYHDSLFMSRIAPAAMIFIPCHQGFSHRPEEFASAADIANGVAVLARTLKGLASSA